MSDSMDDLIEAAWREVLHGGCRALADAVVLGREERWVSAASQELERLVRRELGSVRATIVVDYRREDDRVDFVGRHRGRESWIVIAVCVQYGRYGEWSRVVKFDDVSELARGVYDRRPRRPSVDDQRPRSLTPPSYATWRNLGEPLVHDPGKVAVDRLVSVCRVVAGAVAVQLAASLSLRRWWEIPRQGQTGWMGLCATHGYRRSFHSGARRGTCGQCDVEAERRELVRWSVTWLAAVARSLGDVLATRLRDAVDLLHSVALQAGAALWESLGDWQKRVCMLDLDRGLASSPVGAGEHDPRFELLELD